MFTVVYTCSGGQKEDMISLLGKLMLWLRMVEGERGTAVPSMAWRFRAPDADFAKTAKRKRAQVIENKQSREMPDSEQIMISMSYGVLCETFRFALRNERFVLTRFLAPSTRTTPADRRLRRDRGVHGAFKATAKKLRSDRKRHSSH